MAGCGGTACMRWCEQLCGSTKRVDECFRAFTWAPSATSHRKYGCCGLSRFKKAKVGLAACSHPVFNPPQGAREPGSAELPSPA